MVVRSSNNPTSVRLPKRLRSMAREEARREQRNFTDHLIFILKWWYANGGIKMLRAQANEAQQKFEEMKHGES